MLKRKRWALPLILLLIGFSGISAVLVWLYPREKLLLDHAVPLADTSSWGLDQETVTCWMPDQSLLLLRYVAVGENNNSYKASRYDPASRQETPLPGLTAQLAKSAIAPFDMQLSPDGKWLSWSDYITLTPPPNQKTRMKVVAASLDGAKRVEWQTLDYPSFLWMADSRHWLETQSNSDGTRYTEAFLHSVDAPQESEKRTIDGDFSPQDVYFNDPIARSVNQETLLTEKGAWSDQEATNEIITLHIGPQSLQAKARHKVTLPPNAEIVDIACSPQGDRILWVLNIHSVPGFAAFLRRYLPSFSTPPQTTSGIWVCRADGSDMHEIGHLPRQNELIEADMPTVPQPPSPISAVLTNHGEMSLNEARWLPDGKRISFTVRNTLYTIPAE